MNDLLKSLVDQLKGTSAGAKLIAVLVGLSMLAVIGVSVFVANAPHYEMAFAQLEDHEVGKVAKALSEAGVPFQVSEPPGPYIIFVDRSEKSRALAAAYGAGALDRALKGILAESSGVSSVFMSSGERSQVVRKREWQEMEGMLEELDFVVEARVRTSAEKEAPFRQDAPAPTASVTIQVAESGRLSADQAKTVATLVSRGLGIPRENLTISDQSGETVFEGEMEGQRDTGAQDLLTLKNEFDRYKSAQANGVLDAILGPNKARVTIDSAWDFDHTVLRTDTATKGPEVSVTKNSTETPLDSEGASSAPVGVASNVATDGATVPDESGEPLVAKTDETRTEYKPSTKSEERVRTAPDLKRLSIAVFLDSSVDATKVAALEDAIKAAVGFDEARGDVFSSVHLDFPVAPTADTASEDGADSGTAPEEGGPGQSLFVETLIERGVEIATAIAFLFLLVKSLKISGKSRSAPATAADERVGPDVDPELLARAQVEQLLKADPAKVGEILSSWARGEEAPTAGARS